METGTMTYKSTRFDVRMPQEQKTYFEKAASLGGYRSLTDFIISAVSNKAKEIISESEQIIESRRDSELFFNAIMQQTSPNEALFAAADEYKQKLAEQ